MGFHKIGNGSGAITSSSHVFTNPESTKPDFFSMKFVICFDLLGMDFHLRIEIPSGPAKAS